MKSIHRISARLHNLVVLALLLGGGPNPGWGQITVDGSGNVGIGTTTPQATLEVDGRTVKFSNFEPEYRWSLGGGSDLNWKTFANVNLGTGLYVGAAFVISVFDPDTNWGHSVAAKKQIYYARVARSGGVQDNPNDAQISGPSADYLRIVKTATGVYELQIRQPVNWTRVLVECRATVINNLGSEGSISYVDEPATGSSTGTVYTPASEHTDYFTSGYFSGNVGIGTTSPNAGLELYFPSAEALRVTGDDSYIGFFSTAGVRDGYVQGSGGNTILASDGGVVAINSGGAERMRIVQSGNVGIGTNSPLAKLTIESVIPSAGARPNGGIRFGTPNNQNVSGQIGLVQNSSEGDHYLLIQSVEDSVSWRPVILARDGGNVGIGTATPSHKLQVSGSVRATSFISDTTTYADFVFAEDYDLPTLSEVEAHIEEHGHLPNIPSEAEAMAHGIDLAAMQVKLLQKIEELTLHQIRQQKEIDALKAENARLRTHPNPAYTQ